MEITIRVYILENEYTASRRILLNEGELDDVIGEYLKHEYLKEGETLVSIVYEDIKL